MKKLIIGTMVLAVVMAANAHEVKKTKVDESNAPLAKQKEKVLKSAS